MNHLMEFRRAFRRENACPWPGARPLLAVLSRTEDAHDEERDGPRSEVEHQLRGRGREVAGIAMAVTSNDLVVIHGHSGVGKSSILNVGLVPRLQKLGKIVVVRNDWGISGDENPAEFVTQHARDTGLLRENPFAGGPEYLDRAYPNQIVIVLDQFEELIRNEPGFAHRMLRWVEKEAGQSSVKFVISLRSEYEYQLRNLHTLPFTRRERIEVSQIDDMQIIGEIIAGDEREPMPIDRAAQEMLRVAWVRAQEDDQAHAWNRPGLLHLQATLYVLWMNRKHREGGQRGEGEIRAVDVENLQSQLEEALASRDPLEDPDGDRSLFGFGLEQSVVAATASCERACGDTSQWGGVPLVVRDQTRWMFRDITEHLASGGYKTSRDIWDLARQVLGYLDEPRLRETPAWVRDTYRQVDWLSAPPPAALALDDESTPQPERSPLASGPTATLSTDALLFELYRCYFFALEWMKQANIVQALPTSGSYRVTLTHDRFSQGLQAWRRKQEPDFREAVARYVAHRGKADLGWVDEQIEQGLRPDRMILNVRWRQCVVKDTTFDHVTFVNCDFAGSTFESCTFRGATFVNCVLDGVDFAKCTIKGRPTWHYTSEDWGLLDEGVRRDRAEIPPDFDLVIDHLTAQDAAALTARTVPTSRWSVVRSPSSGNGMVATVVGPAPGRTLPVSLEAIPELPVRPGGLVMCGGRLSSLMFRECAFTGDGVVALRHIAGTSLEICDQTHGSFDIFAAAIRGLVVTRPVGFEGTAPDGRFTFTLSNSVVINSWFGVGLTGTATFENCNVLQLINANQNGLKVAIVNSAFLGAINTGAITDPLSFPLGRADMTEVRISGDAAIMLANASRNIDFRRT